MRKMISVWKRNKRVEGEAISQTPLPGELPRQMAARELQTANGMWRAIIEELKSKGKLFDYDLMLQDNRSESYRDAQEGSLFVLRAPQQVRPPADTGVCYRINKVNQTLELSLNDSPQLPAYERHSLQLETTHKFCQACLDVLNYYCKYREARSNVSFLQESPQHLR